MISPTSYEEIADIIKNKEYLVLFFTADWCPDCQFIYPELPEIEKMFSDFEFIRIDRDDFLDLARTWDVYGIPSLVVLNKGRELGRFVSKVRKTKTEIIAFLADLEGKIQE
ncbi:thioredoxin family protein [Streptococcus sciuri]|uniref:Thioredoxin family protein n=1 Tax=Streptococcus sciuri TaxID=2973939 RepID=A0ABT2F8W1_9STRE|nr:thioredoxin family protein [Streptococcus sciuri]MCS4488812.1 thioredoxin family protein [Streptococcus sciuri]